MISGTFIVMSYDSGMKVYRLLLVCSSSFPDKIIS